MRTLCCLTLAAAALGAIGASAAGPQAAGTVGQLDSTLLRVGDRVQEYYAHAQSIVAVETVRIQRQSADMTPQGHTRQLVYDLRVEWTPPSDDGQPGEATVVRDLLSVDGRPPKAGDDEACMDPEPVSPEPMVMLLPGRRREYAFSLAGPGRTDGKASVMLDYKSLVKGPADIKWRGSCVAVSLPGRSQGRVWVDSATHDVLRLDERLTGMFEFSIPKEHVVTGGPAWLGIERSDSSIRYQTVAFHDPEDTLMLPRSIETTSVWRNAPVARVRITQLFSKYRRFVGDSRILPDAGAR
jgi:hypothetical protein